MAKPIIQKISVFDATKSNTIYFTWDGFQIYKNRITIVNTATNAEVYNHVETNLKTQHTIPANTLTNGINYSATISAVDASNNESTASDSVFFSCMNTPLFEFGNVSNNYTVQNSSLVATISFSQAQNDLIKEYEFLLYDSTKSNTLIDYSGYSDGSTVQYKYTGLLDKEVYYIRCKAVTVAGFNVDTDYIQINVNYVQTNAYTIFDLYCDKNKGTVTGNTNLIVIQDSSGRTFKYKYGGIDLSNDKVIYNSGFKISEDFVFIDEFNRPKKNAVLKKFMSSSDPTKFITLTAEYDDTQLKYRIKLMVVDGDNAYTQYSSYYTVNNADTFVVGLKRQSNVYTLSVKVNANSITPVYNYYGKTAPTTTSEGTKYTYVDGLTTVKVNELNQETYFQRTPPTNPKPYDRFIQINPRNLIPFPYVYTSRTINGITWTVNNDGTITANGTSTGSHFYLHTRYSQSIKLPVGTYMLSGCPSEGSLYKYRITIGYGDSSAYNADLGIDIGSGATVNVTEAIATTKTIQIWITVLNGVTVNNLTFKPMLEAGTVAHPYEPPYSVYKQYSTVNTPPSIIEINHVEVGMAYYKSLYIGNDLSINLTTIPTTYNYNTIMMAGFKHNTNGGNVDFMASSISKVLIKRRENGTFNWTTIFRKDIENNNDFKLNFVDYFARSRAKYQYAIVFCQNDIEWNYNISEVDTEFYGTYLATKDAIWGTIFNTDYCDSTRIQRGSTIEMKNRKKPVAIFNSDVDYETGSASGFFAKYDYETGIVDTDGAFKYQKEFKDFLTDQSAKILKTSDGRIKLIAIPTEISDTNGGHEDLRIISFPWAEIGDYESEKDLYELGLSDVDSTDWSRVYE